MTCGYSGQVRDLAEAMATAISNHKASIEALSQNIQDIKAGQRVALTAIPEVATTTETSSQNEETEKTLQVIFVLFFG